MRKEGTMLRRVSVQMDADAADLLVKLAGSPRRQGEYLSELVRAAASGQANHEDAQLATLRRQAINVANDLTRHAGELAALSNRLIGAVTPKIGEEATT